MKIRVIETEIEADANELRGSQTLAQNFAALLSRCFETTYTSRYSGNEPEEEEDDGQKQKST